MYGFHCDISIHAYIYHALIMSNNPQPSPLQGTGFLRSTSTSGMISLALSLEEQRYEWVDGTINSTDSL